MSTLFGIYDAFTYGGGRTGLFPTAGERLAAISRAGLDLVLNYGTGTMPIEDAHRYANEAEAHSVRVIWNLWIAPDRIRTDAAEFIGAMKAHPATWGFYVGDEAGPGSPEAAEVWRASKLAKASGKPSLYVSRPGRKVMRPFLGAASHVGPDCYPIGKPASWSKPDPQRIGEVAAWAREMVDEPGGAKKLAFVVQAFSWAVDYPAEPELPWPTADQIAAMKRAVLRRGHPEVLLYFCLHCITDYHPDPARYWSEFAAICS